MERAGTVMRAVGLGGMAAFLVIVGTLHLLDPGLTPATHVVSEYANTRFGWLLVIALLGWGASLLATAVWTLSCVQPLATKRLVPGLLVLAAGGLIVAAVFRTQAVGGSVPPDLDRTVAGRLHDAGTGVSTLALFAAAAVVAVTQRATSRLGRTSLALAAFAIVVQVSLLLVGHEVGGIRQRLLVIGACTWQAALLSSPRTVHAP